MGTTKAIRPPDQANVLQTGVLGGKPFQELLERLGKILRRHLVPLSETLALPHTLDIVVRGVNQPPSKE